MKAGKTVRSLSYYVDMEVPEDHPLIYVAYGSNHNVLQMQERCPGAMPISKGMLPDKRLVFSGVLTVEPSEGDKAPVSIWRITRNDIWYLDMYEGFPTLYSKRYAYVTIDGERQRAFYYVLNKPYREYAPSWFYYQTVEDGFKEWGLDLGYLTAARSRAAKFGLVDNRSWVEKIYSREEDDYTEWWEDMMARDRKGEQ